LKRKPSRNRWRKIVRAAAAPLAVTLALAGIPIVVAAQASAKNTSAKSESARTQPANSGNELFQQHCASCHYAETAAQKIGPGLKGLWSRGAFANGKKVTDAGLTKWIEDGGKNMPGLKESLNPEQIRALISYVKSL
jgi:mono/diheme cytochrome c family protein